MKKLLITLVLIGLGGTASADTIKTSVNGLVCGFCATGIEKTFKKQAAVETVNVDLENKLVTLRTKPEQTIKDEEITRLLSDAGYSVTGIVRSK